MIILKYTEVSNEEYTALLHQQQNIGYVQVVQQYCAAHLHGGDG